MTSSPVRGLQALNQSLERSKSEADAEKRRHALLANLWVQSEPKIRLAVERVNAVMTGHSKMRVHLLTDPEEPDDWDEIRVSWSQSDPKVRLGLVRFFDEGWRIICRCRIDGNIGPRELIIKEDLQIIVDESGYVFVSAELHGGNRSGTLLIRGASVEALADVIAEGIRQIIEA